ncbi:hypothetical protein NMR92_001318 [Vibrio cholerae]|uniref:Uncharacterized protein n=1 Tax=Vibrio parahaemolyticus TaxID=670 RepID=A0A1B1LRI8_VIBPH|nr:hypothetical protein [Vibrio parahaemolyticus]EJL6490418.1 hypothetical protein [Vibrio cholerae]ANS55665.1 hypothetical protein [Vibrio parahaemolyticus]EJL6642109.1 hypothetical protein [Vibrio cholerae]MCI9701122.1 hypothetical protein [Vibrio parahaemolyticus]MCR9814104.1 hypothetical protein [Vibrio parahaemolyticus]
MRNTSVEFSGTQNQTPFSILTGINGTKGHSTAHVAHVKKASNKAAGGFKPVAPWYAAVKPQELTLSESVRNALGYKRDDVYQDTIVEKTSFWEALALFGLKHGMLTEFDIENLIEAPIGTTKQVSAAKELGKKVLGFYQTGLTDQQYKIEACFKAFEAPVSIRADIAHWYVTPTESNWGFDLTLDEDECYGEDYDELGQSFNDLSIRIEHCSRVSVLAFDLDQFSPCVGTLYFHTLRLLSIMNYKSMALDYCDNEGTLEKYAEIFKVFDLTSEQVQKITGCDEDSIEEVLNDINPLILKAICSDDEYFDLHDVINAALYYKATVGAKWYQKDTPFYRGQSVIVNAMGLLESVNQIRPNPLNPNDIKGIAALKAALRTVIELGHDTYDSPWLLGSDSPIDCFAFISTGSEAENNTLEMENEHRQSIGESGALRLDLSANDTGLRTIENIHLADKCLMLLASV